MLRVKRIGFVLTLLTAMAAMIGTSAAITLGAESSAVVSPGVTAEASGEAASADAESSFGVTNDGNLANQCGAGGNFVNTASASGSSTALGQYQAETDDISIEGSASTALSQYRTETGDIEISGGTPIVIGGSISGECNQSTTVGG
jgi:hypothetical protein